MNRPSPRKKPARKPKLPPVEVYTPERIAEFLLNNAVDGKDYEWALKKVREMGLDPSKIDHQPPTGYLPARRLT